MLVFYSGKLIVIETNLAWALPYWKRRKAADKRITFIINEGETKCGEIAQP